MDNVTHALAGLLVAEAALGTLGARGLEVTPALRRRAWFVSALTNNLPDLDFLYRGITEGKLGYLLHHRGHTHTFVAALAFGLLTFFTAEALARRRRARHPEALPGVALERGVMLALSFAGGFLHIGLDFFNNYGVHPLWPLRNDWYYGDSIFIVEPWFAVFTVPPLYFASQKIWAKALLASVPVIALGLAWFVPIVNSDAKVALSVGCLFWFWWCKRARTERRAIQSLFASLVVLFAFVLTGQVARGRVLESQAVPGVSRLDAVLTPAPSNPLCWSAVTIAERDTRYELRVLTVSLAPSWVTPEGCRFEPSGQSLPKNTERFDSREHRPDEAVGKPLPGVRLDLVWNAPLAELQSLYRSNCQAKAFLRYSRAPFWFPDGAATTYLGDLRYDRQPDQEFAEVEVETKPSRCPRFVPPWRPPRHELLESR